MEEIIEHQKSINRKLKIGVLIVTYNRKKLLIQCISAIQRQNFAKFDIYIVDNASTDGTEGAVENEKRSDDRIHYLNTGKNLGGAGGFSFGIKEMLQKGYERLWIMDDDTIPEENALEELLFADSFLKGNYGFLSSYVAWIDDMPCVMNRPQLQEDWITQLQNIKYGLLPVRRATFVSMFLNAEAVKQLGLPIREFFIWGDDWEYTDRISAEMNNFLVIRSKVLHKTENNVGSDISNDSTYRIDRYYYSFRNEFYLARRNGTLAVMYYLYRVIGTIKAILRSNSEKKGKRIIVVIKGMGSGFFFHPTIEYPIKKRGNDSETDK